MRRKKVLYAAPIALVLLIITALILLKAILGLSVFAVFSQKFPVSDAIKISFPDSYLVEKHSYFEKQDKNQCGGYASAYVLRCMGETIAGDENYERLGLKLSNGYVLPQALTDAFAAYGYAATLYRGDLEHLKTRLARGSPIVVLIGHRLSWQHYVTVVGYDEDNIYLYDSQRDADNSKGYNRTIGNEEFLNFWNNKLPFFERTYFVID